MNVYGCLGKVSVVKEIEQTIDVILRGRNEKLYKLIVDMLILQFKRQYEKAFRESERARELFNKADADINLSRAEVEKV